MHKRSARARHRARRSRDLRVPVRPVGRNKFDTQSCDVARSFLSKAGVSYDSVKLPAGAVAEIHVGDTVLVAPDTSKLDGKTRADAIADFNKQTRAALDAVGYPAAAADAQIDKPMVVGILALLVLYVTMVYGPIAAMLVELFPTRIRCTSMSLRPTISAMAGSAASCRRRRSPSSRPPAISIAASGIRSSSRA